MAETASPGGRLSDVSIANLQLLAALEQSGSITRVARRFGLSQPTVSSRLAGLERGLGVAILERGPRGTNLTPAGEAIVSWSARLREEAALFDDLAGTLAELPGRPLRVAASMTIAEYLVPRWVTHPRLTAVAEGSRLELVVRNSADVLRLVLDGHADLGFVEGPEVPGSLVPTVVADDELVVVVGVGHEWFGRADPIGVDELLGTRLVVREVGSGTREVLERALAEHGRHLGDRFPSLGSTAAILTSVRHAGSAAVLSRRVVADDVDRGRLHLVEVRGLRLDRRLRAVRAAARPLRPEARILIEVARALEAGSA